MSERAEKRILKTVLMAGFLTLASGAEADQRDLYSGLAYLRSGAQAEAEAALTQYVATERDSDVRRSITRVLPLLKQPLSKDVREYLASSIEAQAGPPVATALAGRRPGYWSRIFPVFP